MAEGLIRARLEREGLAGEIEVLSAGTWASEGIPPTDHAIAAMQERGIDISDQESVEVDAELIRRAELILVMTEGHLIGIRTDFPEADAKIRLMSSLAGGSWDVADPVGGSLDDYLVTADELERLVDAGWDEIVGRPATDDRRSGS